MFLVSDGEVLFIADGAGGDVDSPMGIKSELGVADGTDAAAVLLVVDTGIGG